jgi:hypothetical protein
LQSQEIAEDEAPRFQAEYEASLRGTGVDATATISSDIITDDKIEESTATKTPAKKA